MLNKPSIHSKLATKCASPNWINHIKYVVRLTNETICETWKATFYYNYERGKVEEIKTKQAVHDVLYVLTKLLNIFNKDGKSYSLDSQYSEYFIEINDYQSKKAEFQTSLDRLNNSNYTQILDLFGKCQKLLISIRRSQVADVRNNYMLSLELQSSKEPKQILIPKNPKKVEEIAHFFKRKYEKDRSEMDEERNELSDRMDEMKEQIKRKKRKNKELK